jgi:V/A-type H+-transporting ATPase subunit F
VKIAVLTDAESAAGYRLAGLDVAVATEAKEAVEVLARLIREETYAIIAVSESLLPDPYQVVRREMRGRHLPVLLTTPSLVSALAEEGEDAKEYMRRLIVETMGYEIKAW